MSKRKVDDGYKRNLVMYYLIKPVLLLVAKILYNPEIIGKENIPEKDGCLVACNHVHAFDPPILIYSMKRVIHFIAKKELFDGKMKWFYLSFGTIPVDRSKKNPLALAVAEEYLNNDEIVGIFPEGTRNKDCESLLPFKFGAVKMAKVTGKKIVPCVITGSYKIFSRNLKVRFGKAIDIKSMSLEDANEFLRNTMLKMLEEK